MTMGRVGQNVHNHGKRQLLMDGTSSDTQPFWSDWCVTNILLICSNTLLKGESTGQERRGVQSKPVMQSLRSFFMGGSCEMCLASIIRE